MLDRFVALDLETTGLQPGTDEIIEVGAVRFQNGRPVEEFHTLANPRRPVPEGIQRLTGISPQELAKAPPFDRLAARVLSFIGSDTVVGHSVSFDLGFLAARGVKPPGPAQDTYHLACLLYPESQEYSLVAVARQVGLTLPAEHRALNHASATAAVFLALEKAIEGLQPSLRNEIARLGRVAGAPWHALFQLQGQDLTIAQPPDNGSQFMARLPALDAEPLAPKPALSPLAIEIVASLLQPGGALESAIPGFEHRAQQVEMARAVAEALNQGQQLIVEAGTGTGKSMAYLLPSMFFAQENQERIVLSTNTINLQEQLIGKDIPQLKQALAPLKDLRTAILKGRANYLCLQRWQAFRQSLVLSPEEALFLARTLVWLGHTQTGDKAELRILPQETGLWNNVAATDVNCHRNGCPYHEEDGCFLYRARKQAESAHVVVTNHALLLSEVASGARILPDYDHLIIDEAHHLEDEATEQLGVRITSQQVTWHLNQIGQRRRQGIATGLLAEVEASIRQARAAASLLKDMETLLGQCHSDLEASRICSGQLFRTLAQFISGREGSLRAYETRLRLTSAVRAQPGWSDIEIAGENLTLALHQLGTTLGKLHSALENSEGMAARSEGLASRVASVVTDNSQLEQQLKDILFSPDKKRVYWSTAGADEETSSLASAPLQVGDTLNDSLYARKKCLVLTSATLSTQGHLHYARERLGLESAQELVLGSPFDYKSSTLVYILDTIPAPNQPGYQTGVEEAIAALALAAEGRTLALFTSYASLQATLEAVRPRLEAQGIQVLGQRTDGSPQQLLRTFKSSPRALLLGTSAFWEGIDVPGDALSLLIIPRLPFPVPTDPIFEARCELLDDGFNQYSVPQAILRLKQGFGRLIRRRTDRGVVALLDRRIKAQRYGKAFLDSLPPCTVRSGPLRQMVSEVTAWLSAPR